jgi:hypothetical protein
VWAQHGSGFVASPYQYTGTQIGSRIGGAIGGARGASIGGKIGRGAAIAAEWAPEAYTGYSAITAVNRHRQSRKAQQNPVMNAALPGQNGDSWQSKRLQLARNEAQGQRDMKPLTYSQRIERKRAAVKASVDRRTGVLMTQRGQVGSIAGDNLRRQGMSQTPAMGV